MPRVTAKEWGRVLALILVIVGLTSVPYTIGFVRSDTDHVYSGATLDLVDYNSYLTKMQQGIRGSWQFSFLYTSEEHPGAYVYPFYLLLGHVARWTGQSVLTVYHIARVVFAAAMMVTVYTFIATLISSPALRWLAFILACASSGLGWLQLLVSPALPGGISPIDFWLIDGFPFFSMLTFPHFTVSIALMSLILVETLALWARPTLRLAVFAGCCSLALTMIHPFSGALVILIVAVYAALCIWMRRLIWYQGVGSSLVVTLPALPVLVYDAWSFSVQSAFRTWSSQLVMPSPPPVYYLASYGLLLVLAIVGAVRLVRHWQHGSKSMLAVVWLVVVIPLLYAPTNLQRRFLEGVMLPLCILASVGAVVVLHRLIRMRRWRRLVLLLLIALTWPSNLALVAGTSIATFNLSPSMFYSGTVVAAVDWLGARAQPNDIVLSSFEVGNLIPARTGLRVVLGHWIETLDYDRKTEQVRAFFEATTSDETRRALLQDERVNYVFFGPDERKLGAFVPSRAAYLAEVFRANDVAVYRVMSP